MKILVVCKGSLDRAVPIISISQAFHALCNSVTILCGNISHGLAVELQSEGIEIISLNIKEDYYDGTIAKAALKLGHWQAFRTKVRQIINEKQADLLYVSTADTAIALYGLLRGYKYILHLRELHDQQPHYMLLLRKLAREASRVVVPEENRAYLYYSMLGLPEIPSVIPNKPYNHPRKACLEISFLGSELNNQIRGKKNILYQGALHVERDLTPLIRASNTLEDYNIVLLGRDYGMLNCYLQINPNLIHIPFVRPPLHLNITSWAHIGVITYDFASLNTIYCAPNKIWEFSGFGIPILGNTNPGISGVIRKFDAGKVVDFADESDIIRGIQLIEEKYCIIHGNANILYDSFDIVGAVEKLIAGE